MQTAKKLGASATSLPILVVDGEVIQGSDKIFDWAEEISKMSPSSLTPVDMKDCLTIEKRLDNILGVHIRRYFYSEILVEYPDQVRSEYIKDLSLLNKIMFYLAWGMIQKRMIEFMDLGKQQRLESREIILGELNWMDKMLSDGRPYLIGDKFSRADITAASLLAPITIPAEHPVYEMDTLPKLMAQDVRDWQNRPSINWVHNIYNKHRKNH